MKEVYLYMCEECGMCMFDNNDKGNVSYSSYCAGCKRASFFKKVIITTEFNLKPYRNETRSVFAVKEKEEKQDKFKGMGSCGHFNCEGDHT